MEVAVFQMLKHDIHFCDDENSLAQVAELDEAINDLNTKRKQLVDRTKTVKSIIKSIHEDEISLC